VDNWGGWADVVRIASAAAPLAQYAGPGGFNDLDMMVSPGIVLDSEVDVLGRLADCHQIIGNGKLSAAEERTHFAIWAIAKSPIILGTDVTKLSSATLALVKNKVYSVHRRSK